MEKEKKSIEANKENCNDETCWIHGSLKVRGRVFKGYVVKKFPRRIVVEFERTIYIKKYERYAKKQTRIHARLPECMQNSIDAGDYAEIGECRPLSKLIHFVLIKKIEEAGK